MGILEVEDDHSASHISVFFSYVPPIKMNKIEFRVLVKKSVCYNKPNQSQSSPIKTALIVDLIRLCTGVPNVLARERTCFDGHFLMCKKCS